MTALPEPAARSADEAALLRAVLVDLPNDLPKLVYADWLDDRGDGRGEFLRRFVHAAQAGADLPDPPPGLPAGWLELTGVGLLTDLRRHGLGDLAPALLPLAWPCLQPAADATSDTGLPVGASKFGGDPDLPAGFDWPADADGPLPFLAQFDLATLHRSPAAHGLPANGLLSVFGGLDDRSGEGRGEVALHHGPLVRRPGGPTGPSCRLQFTEVLSLPATDSPWADELDRLLGDRDQAYHEATQDRPGLTHHLLGHPRPLQSGFLHDRDERVLLTLDSDDAAGWMWGDAGLLYLTLPADDLAAGRFDRLRVEMQCC